MDGRAMNESPALHQVESDPHSPADRHKAPEAHNSVHDDGSERSFCVYPVRSEQCGKTALHDDEATRSNRQACSDLCESVDDKDIPPRDSDVQCLHCAHQHRAVIEPVQQPQPEHLCPSERVKTDGFQMVEETPLRVEQPFTTRNVSAHKGAQSRCGVFHRRQSSRKRHRGNQDRYSGETEPRPI